MKKIISIIGLSIAFTVSPVSASDLTITEPLADEPLTVENRFKGFYIKPFLGSWHLSTLQSNGVSYTNLRVPRIQKKINKVDYFIDSCGMVTEASLIGGIAVGKHLNEHIGIEGSAGYYRSNHFNFNTKYLTNDYTTVLGYIVNPGYLGIINAILSPTISLNIIGSISLYFTAGLGASYIMFSDNHNNWDMIINGLVLNYSQTKKLFHDVAEVRHYNNAQKFHLSWVVGAGIRIRLTESTELDIGYSYKSLGKLPTSNLYQDQAKEGGVSFIPSMPLLVHEVLIGIKFNF